MKRTTMWAMALTVGATAFTACSSDEAVFNDAPVNPTYNGESVKTQFAINIPNAAPQKRMTSEDTQGEGNNFIGMTGIRLIPMTETGAASKTFPQIIGLQDIGNTEISSSDCHKVYNDVDVAVGTNNFLFYGFSQAATSADDKAKYGNLTTNFPSSESNYKTDNISFNLEKIGNMDATMSAAVLTLINGVLKANGTYGGNEVTWAGSDNLTLAQLYTKYKTSKAGNGKAVQIMMQDLYNSVNTLATASTESKEKAVAIAIQNAIKTVFDAGAESGGVISLTYKSGTDYSNFPSTTGKNLPAGCAILAYNETTNQFNWSTDAVIGVTTGDYIKAINVCYPSNIAYFTNTPIYTNNSANVTTWPQTITEWNTADKWNGWASSVVSTTRTIALKNNVQYANASLVTKVKCSASTLEDNRYNQTSGAAANQNISVPSEGFTITGILVGGQPAKAGWDLFPAASTTFDQVIYDNSMPTGMTAKASVYSFPNYTLVLDNQQGTAEPVYIAVELVNNGTQEFYGADGKVGVGQKFYLIAKLDPTGKTVTDVTAPYIFMQDYQTTADLTIASLKNAYVTIPDLRASKLQLGLSVDLQWKSGMSFEVEIP